MIEKYALYCCQGTLAMVRNLAKGCQGSHDTGLYGMLRSEVPIVDR